MKVRIIHPSNAIGMLDPHTKRSPFIDPETGKVIEVADVPDGTFWTRRVLDGELEVVEETATSSPKRDVTPTGREAVAPLTTR
jgi:hypothetical protein